MHNIGSVAEEAVKKTKFTIDERVTYNSILVFGGLSLAASVGIGAAIGVDEALDGESFVHAAESAAFFAVAIQSGPGFLSIVAGTAVTYGFFKAGQYILNHIPSRNNTKEFSEFTPPVADVGAVYDLSPDSQ